MDTIYTPSEHLYQPLQGHLKSYSNPLHNPEQLESIEKEVRDLISQKNYPCVAALRSYHKDDYQVGLYGEFGSGSSWRKLRNDLLYFLQEQKKTSSIYLSFWAIFEDFQGDEEEFENAMWRELSHLTSEEDRQTDWPTQASQDPNDPNFRFSLGGSEFFVVGLHPKSSRMARRFSRPTLIFNVYNQFEQLMKLGQYQGMVDLNRQRDERFQGSVNPMVAKHGESWESIQFSGKSNPSTWKCPFSFLKRLAKP